MAESLYFDLNAQDRITAVSANWDYVASTQNGLAACADSVIGKSIWVFISGPTTQDFFANLFALARDVGRAVTLPYRCDAPLQIRHFNMEISRLPWVDLRVTHHFIPEATEDYSVIHTHDYNHEKICSICLSVRRNGAWLDEYYSPRSPIDASDFTVCPKCESAPKLA